LDDFRNIVKKSNKAQYLTLRTSDNLYAVLSMSKIIHDEEALSSRYFYKPSKLLAALK
jgi:hypothetical protein